MASHTHRGATPPTTEYLPQAVLWDMDGTLVDTEVHWFAAEAELMAAHNIAWGHQDSLDMVGSSEENTIRTMQAHGLPLSGPQIVEGLHSRVLSGIHRDLPLRPGALDLLLECHAAGVPTALVTNSGSTLATAVLDQLTVMARERGWMGEQLFEVVVTGDLGLPGKPAPAPYVFAARRLAALQAEGRQAADTATSLEPGQMVAIEDSVTGIRSARDAGVTAVGVVHLTSLADADAHVLLDTLDGVTVTDLGTCVQRAQNVEPGQGGVASSHHTWQQSAPKDQDTP
ncbi:HAD family hydrolase [Kocuria sp.]|uniref:HAD family hydrolase n=1 Tax=Kocuria sp. TaxID=1871328 RepID=UPI0026E09FCC|nr:HAD family phosphatase [Kocuria sp.]MDO5619672.1 HAD family phosphatase [Kocuria sp.]